MNTIVGFPGISGWSRGEKKPSSLSIGRIRWRALMLSEISRFSVGTGCRRNDLTNDTHQQKIDRDVVDSVAIIVDRDDVFGRHSQTEFW
jgi:hypothetical protein